MLRSSVREYLCSEAMFHLGVPTTRALSLVLTGDSECPNPFVVGTEMRCFMVIIISGAPISVLTVDSECPCPPLAGAGSRYFMLSCNLLVVSCVLTVDSRCSSAPRSFDGSWWSAIPLRDGPEGPSGTFCHQLLVSALGHGY